MFDALIFNYLLGILAIIGATPIEGGSEVRNSGNHRIWIVAGILPYVNRNISVKKVEIILEIYCQLCQHLSDIIDVAPYKVTIYKHDNERHVYISVYN